MRGVTTDLTGKRYGNLLVVGFAPRLGAGSWWHCQCDCGLTCVKAGKDLTKKTPELWVHSCGCRTQLAHAIGKGLSSRRNTYLRALRR